MAKRFFYIVGVPSYRVYLKIKNTTKSVLGLDKETNLYLLSHRRAVHVLVLILFFVTVLTNWQIGETRAETQFGENIILASLVDSEELGLISEESFRGEISTVASYAEEEDFIIESTPGIETADSTSTIPESTITTTEDQGVLIKPEIPSGTATQEIQEAQGTTQRQNTIEYVVQQGDNIGKIARKFDLSNETILLQNNLNSYSIIRPGDKLLIPPIDGLEHKVKSGETLLAIAKKYGVDSDKIIDYNNLVDADDIFINQKLFIPGGKAPVVVPQVQGRSKLAELIIPSPAPIVSDSRMLWPTDTKRITQYYKWRHSGIDIARKGGNVPIYAADDGVVTLVKNSGWNGGYGKNIIIDHGGNKKTLYAHNSKNFVKVGDRVKKGDVIAFMGNTGRSTGQHLHFEVRFGTTRVNPLKYVK